MNATIPSLPNLNELGKDLLVVSRGQKCFALSMPFILGGAYFIPAAYQIWWAALLCPILVSFFSLMDRYLMIWRIGT